MLLKSGASLVNELVSMRWDVERERLMGIAIMDDGSYYCAIDR